MKAKEIASMVIIWWHMTGSGEEKGCWESGEKKVNETESSEKDSRRKEREEMV